MRGLDDGVALNERVWEYWEREPCGSGADVVGGVHPLSAEWFRRIESHRYEAEPFIHGVAQFTLHAGKKILEVGVGAGTDHVQWARVAGECFGVDLTEAAIVTTRAHLAVHGLTSNPQRMDAETLPFPAAWFDVVYSWGVIHHSAHPERILAEIRRVLYGCHSITAAKMWVRHALLTGRPARSLADVVWHHCESVGTKAYTPSELRTLFGTFREIAVQPILTPYDTKRLPRFLHAWLPSRLGWFTAIRATR